MVLRLTTPYDALRNWRGGHPLVRRLTPPPHPRPRCAQVVALRELSDELSLDEAQCVELWAAVSRPATRRWLEEQLGAPVGFDTFF